MEHPILEFSRGRKIKFYLDDQELEGLEGETIGAALHASGVRIYGYSHRRGRPRGFYCGIGNCSSCLMTVDGIPNVRVCVTKLTAGMKVQTQQGKGELVAKD